MPVPEFVVALREKVGTDPLWLIGVTAIVLDGDRVLLGRRADTGRWSTVSGIVEPGEHPAVAVVREVLEETGLTLRLADVGPVVATRVADFEFDGATYHQSEWFFAMEVDRFEPHGAGWEPIEHRALLAYKWWTVDELEATDAVVYPTEMATVLRAVLAGPLTQPFALSGA
jgi:8-oxo-dGTP pyrophosphatase MutT (NUDIX family)